MCGGCLKLFEPTHDRWSGSEVFQNRLKLCSAARTNGGEGAARKHDCVSVGALVGVAVCHQAITDARSDGNVDEMILFAPGAENCLRQSRRSDVRFDLCGGDS